jgi:hypothetical protein
VFFDGVNWVSATSLPDGSNYLGRPGVNNQTGISYNLVLSDENKVVRCANTNSIAVNVPDNTTLDFPVGTVIQLRQVDEGKITLVPAATVTVNTPESLISRKAGSTITLMKVAANEWDLTGDMEAAT